MKRHLQEGTDQNHEKSVRITGTPADIRTEYIQRYPGRWALNY
jgi:hypothetical protein